MRRYVSSLSLAVLALSASAASVYAIAIAMPVPGPQRMGNADALVLGRVVGVEPQDVEAEPFPGNPGKQKFRIAVVKVSEVIRGAKDMKSIRVAFYPPPENVPDNPGGGIRIRPGFRRNNLTLEVGQDGLFILNKHHKENFYLPPQFGNFVSSQQEDNFKKEVEFAKKAAKILDNPMASLKSKDGEERMQALSIMINKYRNPGPAVGHKTERVAADESKLVLNALLEGTWNAQPQRFGQLDSWNLFNQLGLDQDKDSGWKSPQNAQNMTQLHDAAKTWLKANADTYRIQRMVPTDKPNNPQVNPGSIRIQPVPGGIQIQPVPGGIQIQPQPIEIEVQIQPGVIRPIRIQPAPQPQRD